MLSAQGDAQQSSRSVKAGKPAGWRISWKMILLGVALLICALALYLYALSNRPLPSRTSSSISNINRIPPGQENAWPSPSPTPGRPRPKATTPVPQQSVNGAPARNQRR